MLLLDISRTGRIAQLKNQLIWQVWLPWIAVSIIVPLLIYIASAIGLMKMFDKAGEKSWKAWIPFYNTYLLFKLCWETKWFWPIVAGTIIVVVFGNLKFGVGDPRPVIFAVLIVIVAIGMFVLRCFLANFISKAYGKTIGWTIGLIFIPWLFYLFLGFGEAKYKDNLPKKKRAKEGPKTLAKAKRPVVRKSDSSKAPKAQVKRSAKPKKNKPVEEKKSSTKKKTSTERKASTKKKPSTQKKPGTPKKKPVAQKKK